MRITIKILRLRVMLALLACPAYAFGSCMDNLDGTFTCTGTSTNPGASQIGVTTLDNASGPVTLDNVEGLIGNNGIASTVGATNTMLTNGNSNVIINNTIGTIFVDRSSAYVDPSLFTASGTGSLLNNGTTAGVAAAIYSDANTASLVINNLSGFDSLGNFGGMIRTDDPSIGNPSDFSAAIYGSAQSQIIHNVGGLIYNIGFSYGADTLAEGHWAIANFGTGSTTVDISANAIGGGSVIGDILILDRNPLMVAAQKLDPSLVLAYGASDVGIRDSVITIGAVGDVLQSNITGNIYLGSGTHVVNITPAGVMNGNIYVDQSSTSTTDASGNILTTVDGSRQFTFNNSGQMDAAYSITLNDVVGAVNVLNYKLGYFDVNTQTNSSNDTNSLSANGLGNNILNAACYFGTQDQSTGRCGIGNLTGITTLNLSGTRFDLGNTYQLIGDANLNATDIHLANSAVLTAANVNVGSGATLAGDTSSTIGAINANLINNGTIDLGTATLNVSGNASFNSGSSIRTTISASSYGKILLSGTGIVANGVTLVPSVSGATLTNGQTFIIATNTTGTPTVANGTGLFQWSVSNSGGNLVLGVHLGIPSFLAPTVSQAATNVTDFLVNYHGINADLLKLNSELMALTGAEVKRHVERLRPEIHDGALRLAMSGSDRLMGIIESRLFSLQYTGPRAAAGPAGIASGDSLSVQPGVWAQGYAFDGAQESTRIYDGYSIAATGMAFGADRLFGDSERLRVGGAFSYASGKVDNTGYTDVNRINIGSYFATAYTAWAGDPWYVNGALGVGRHTYDTQRSALGRSADGSHDAWQLGARLDAGWPLAVNDSLTLVPAARLSYSRLDESAYDEHGSIIALQIDGRTTESLRGGLGGRALYTLQEEDWLAALELRAMLNHEFGDVAQDSTARFVAGGSSFASPGVRPARDSLLLGGSIRLTGDDDQDQLSLLLNYDSELRERYFSQALSMTLRYDFDQGPAFRQQAEARKALTSAKSGVATAAPSVTVTERDVAAIQQAITGTDAGSVRRQQAVADALYAWVNAMANKNVEVYFNSYAADFVTPDGGSRQAWERKRKTELARGGSSAIKVSYLTIKPSGSRASAVFTQTAAIGDSKEVTLKSVDFAEKNGRWLIVREDGMAVPE